MSKPVLWILFLIACAIGLLSQSKDLKPKLTDQQKLELRTSQVKMFQAKSILESTPQFKVFAAAQDQMNELGLKVQREIGCLPPKWVFTQELECVAVQEEPAKPEKK